MRTQVASALVALVAPSIAPIRSGTGPVTLEQAATPTAITAVSTLALGAARYAETRDRPDAATFDWNQLRLHARITWLIASASDALPLPPAIRRTPRTVH